MFVEGGRNIVIKAQERISHRVEVVERERGKTLDILQDLNQTLRNHTFNELRYTRGEGDRLETTWKRMGSGIK